MKEHFFSGIKWRLLIISFFLVTVPTVVIGIQTYNISQREAFANVEKNLKNISKDWFNISKIYALEKDRILKREEFLYQKRLESIVLDVEKIIETAGDNPSATALEKVLRKVGEIQIAKTGNVIAFNSRGDILLMKKKLVKGKNFSTSVNAKFFADVSEKMKDAKEKETFTFYYDWSDDEIEVPRTRVGTFVYVRALDLFIGANAYLTDFKSTDLDEKIKDELKYLMAEQKIGEHGYIWAINTQGEYIVSKDMYRNGENILDTKDQNGEYPIRTIIAETKQLPPGDAHVHYYSWRNLGEKVDSAIVSATVYAPDWDWVIGVSAYNNDFLGGLNAIKKQIIYTVIIMVMLGSIIAYLFASFVSRPIMKLEHIAIEVAEGKLDENIEDDLTKKTGEIGNLARAFNAMIFNLRNKIDILNTTNVNLLKTEEDLEKNLEEISRMNKLMIGRELRMVELKKEIKELKSRLGENNEEKDEGNGTTVT